MTVLTGLVVILNKMHEHAHTLSNIILLPQLMYLLILSCNIFHLYIVVFNCMSMCVLMSMEATCITVQLQVELHYPLWDSCEVKYSRELLLLFSFYVCYCTVFVNTTQSDNTEWPLSDINLSLYLYVYVTVCIHICVTVWICSSDDDEAMTYEVLQVFVDCHMCTVAPALN